MNHFNKCNLSCIFCVEKNRTEVVKPYNITPVFRELYAKRYMREETMVAWGGGEGEAVNNYMQNYENVDKDLYIKRAGTLYQKATAAGLEVNVNYWDKEDVVGISQLSL